MSTPPASVAYVGSLLPARFLVDYGAALDVRRIVVLTETHRQSFSYVARRLPGVEVVRLGGGTVAGTARLAWQLLVAKMRGRRVVFFHECCWPAFDVLVSLIKPEGLFFPQVTMAGFEPAPLREAARAGEDGGVARRLFAAVLGDRFVAFRAPKDHGAGGDDFLVACRQYPPCVKVFPVGYAPAEGRRPGDRPPAPDSNARAVPRVIFVGGSEPIADDALATIYDRLMRVAHAAGYEVYLKDHPLHRMTVACDVCTEIDPAMPIDLVDDRFAISIGVASTALFEVGDRKISILEALDDMPEDAKRVRRERLFSQHRSDARRIEFVQRLDELEAILREPAVLTSAGGRR